MLSSEELKGVLVIRCDSDVVYEKAETFKLMLDRFLNGDSRRVVLNLENSRYLCSSALGAIASGCSRLRELGGDLVLTGLTTDLSRLLQVTRLTNVIQVARDLDQAVALLEQSPAGTE